MTSTARPGSLTVCRYTSGEGWTVLEDRLPLPPSTDLTTEALTELLERWVELTNPAPGIYWTEYGPIYGTDPLFVTRVSVPSMEVEHR